MNRLFYFCNVFLCSMSVAFAQQLVSFTPLDTLAPAELDADFAVQNAQDTLDVYKVLYTTLDTDGQTDTASGIMAIPRNRLLRYPMLVYMHGTVDGREDVPSRKAGGYYFSISTAAHGYIMVAPDYLGMGDSRRAIHPYVHAASEASVGLDLITAGKALMDSIGVAYQNQLFSTGYSQGGHASMALHQKVETENLTDFPLVAASHMSGPYSISGVMVERTLRDQAYLVPGYLGWTLISYQSVYGNLFDDLSEVLKAPYAGYVQEFADEKVSFFQMSLNVLIALNLSGTGGLNKFMLQDSIRIGMETDPNHRINVALRDNDQFNWVPKLPTRLMYCDADQQVPGENAIFTDSVMNANGAADVKAILPRLGGDHGTCGVPALDSTMAFFAQYAIIDSVAITHAKTPIAQQIRIWPNPTTGELKVKLGNLAGTSISLFNLQGQQVWESALIGQGQLSFRLPVLPPGAYMLQVVSQGRRYSQMLQIQRP